MKISIVILHYETVDDTISCLNSLIKYFKSTNEISVVVVDNGSQIGKLDKIEEQYSVYKNIIFIRSEKNLGFANGNNIGFQYVKQNFNPDIIILANNDLVFKQDTFVENLTLFEQKTHFDIAGPRIISLVDGLNQNPVKKLYNSKKDVKKRIIKFEILFFLCLANFDLILKNKISEKICEYTINNHEDYQLHGACMFFSNRFVKEFDGLYEGTFMYGEESILKFIADKYNLIMLYDDSTEVLHKEGLSTKKIFGKGRKQRLFFYKWNIRSCKELLKLMEK